MDCASDFSTSFKRACTACPTIMSDRSNSVPSSSDLNLHIWRRLHCWQKHNPRKTFLCYSRDTCDIPHKKKHPIFTPRKATRMSLRKRGLCNYLNLSDKLNLTSALQQGHLSRGIQWNGNTKRQWWSLARQASWQLCPTKSQKRSLLDNTSYYTINQTELQLQKLWVVRP